MRSSAAGIAAGPSISTRCRAAELPAAKPKSPWPRNAKCAATRSSSSAENVPRALRHPPTAACPKTVKQPKSLQGHTRDSPPTEEQRRSCRESELGYHQLRWAVAIEANLACGVRRSRLQRERRGTATAELAYLGGVPVHHQRKSQITTAAMGRAIVQRQDSFGAGPASAPAASSTRRRRHRQSQLLRQHPAKKQQVAVPAARNSTDECS